MASLQTQHLIVFNSISKQAVVHFTWVKHTISENFCTIIETDINQQPHLQFRESFRVSFQFLCPKSGVLCLMSYVPCPMALSLQCLKHFSPLKSCKVELDNEKQHHQIIFSGNEEISTFGMNLSNLIYFNYNYLVLVSTLLPTLITTQSMLHSWYTIFTLCSC